MPRDRAPLAYLLHWSRATESLHAGDSAARLMRATACPAALDDAIRHYREGRARWLAGLRGGTVELLADHSEAWTTMVPLLTAAIAMERNLHAGSFEHSPALTLLCEEHAEVLVLLEDSLR